MMRALPFGLLLLFATACLRVEPDEAPVAHAPCSEGPACAVGADASFSLLRIRRSGGPDRDNASYRFTLDGQVCVVDATGIACTDTEGAPSRVFVAADVTEEGVGRTFRVDTLGRASSHLVIQRNDVTIDEFDHQPTLVRPCGGFAFDRGQERVLPELGP